VGAIERQSFSNPWPESSFLGEIENESVSFPFVIVYKPEEKVIGYLIYWKIGDEAQISNVAVHPDWRGQGIGERVIREILELMKKQGVRYVVLEVRPSNQVARYLYNKLGFEVIGVRKGYYKNPPENALIMGKILQDK
jgi:ribosomal-protein-alanine N-acetyltransferase